MPPDSSTPSAVHAYETGAAYDEAFDSSGRPRPRYEDVLARVAEVDLEEVARDITRSLEKRGVAFGGDEGHPFTVDAVPRILTSAEWHELSAGVGQRVRALDAFLHDVYGDQRAVEDGIVPERVVSGSAYFEEDLRGLQPAAGARVSVAGLDVIRDDTGRFHVLEDNVRTPSGIAYAVAAADAVSEALYLPRPNAYAPDELAAALLHVLEASAPEIEGELVLLTDGPGNSAWFEHAWLAEAAGLALATPDEVVRRGKHVELRDGRRVRAVYRRTEEDRVRDRSGRLTGVADLLLQPLHEGTVGLVNWFGNGVADDKFVYAYVDELIRYYLEEEPVVRSVRTYDLRDAGRLQEVLDRLPELVVKPRSGQGGQGVVVGGTADADELERARAAIRESPEDWIAQDTVVLSTHPTVVDGRLVPRHVDLRPFAFWDGEDVVVPPGALTRVAMQKGAMVVNSSREGGGKATWIGE